jgi:hypothetical protein
MSYFAFRFPERFVFLMLQALLVPLLFFNKLKMLGEQNKAYNTIFCNFSTLLMLFPC